MSRKKTV